MSGWKGNTVIIWKTLRGNIEMKTDKEWLINNDWLLGTRSNSKDTVIVNMASDEYFMERIKQELALSVKLCRNGDPRVRVTIEVLDNGL